MPTPVKLDTDLTRVAHFSSFLVTANTWHSPPRPSRGRPERTSMAEPLLSVEHLDISYDGAG
jgi:hypothetical protein